MLLNHSTGLSKNISPMLTNWFTIMSVLRCLNQSHFLNQKASFFPLFRVQREALWPWKKPQIVPVSRTPFPSVSQWEVWNTVQSFALLEDFAHTHATARYFQIFSWWIFLAKLNFYFDLSKNLLYYDNIKHNGSKRYHKTCDFFIACENVARLMKIKMKQKNLNGIFCLKFLEIFKFLWRKRTFPPPSKNPPIQIPT